MRICSLLPSATEILYALGLGDAVVGVTHECDYPPDAAKKPPLIRPRVDPQASPAAIDRAVAEIVSRGESIYAVDGDLLASLAPDLIITQDLCHVCAASPEDLATALTRFSKRPKILSLSPHSLTDVWEDVRRIGEATGRRRDAQGLAISLAQRVAAIEMKVAAAPAPAPKPRVLCLEWMDPFYIAGHWVPEMVVKAGGEDVLGRAGQPSFRAAAEQIAKTGADIIVLMPCGYSTRRAADEFDLNALPSSWGKLPAIRDKRVFAVDANSYFSRPGPRLADGVELLGHLFHPQLVPLIMTDGAFKIL